MVKVNKMNNKDKIGQVIIGESRKDKIFKEANIFLNGVIGAAIFFSGFEFFIIKGFNFLGVIYLILGIFLSIAIIYALIKTDNNKDTYKIDLW
jgi:hypothetical protein